MSSTSTIPTLTWRSLQLLAAFPSHHDPIYCFHFDCLREWCLCHSSAEHTIRASQTKDTLYAYFIQDYSGHISAIITKSIKIGRQCRSQNVPPSSWYVECRCRVGYAAANVDRDSIRGTNPLQSFCEVFSPIAATLWNPILVVVSCIIHFEYSFFTQL